MKYLTTAAKALLGALIAGLGSLATVLVGDSNFGDITDGQWVSVGLVTLVALGGVYAIPNKQEEK